MVVAAGVLVTHAAGVVEVALVLVGDSGGSGGGGGSCGCGGAGGVRARRRDWRATMCGGEGVGVCDVRVGNCVGEGGVSVALGSARGVRGCGVWGGKQR